MTNTQIASKSCVKGCLSHIWRLSLLSLNLNPIFLSVGQTFYCSIEKTKNHGVCFVILSHSASSFWPMCSFVPQLNNQASVQCLILPFGKISIMIFYSQYPPLFMVLSQAVHQKEPCRFQNHFQAIPWSDLYLAGQGWSVSGLFFKIVHRWWSTAMTFPKGLLHLLSSNHSTFVSSVYHNWATALNDTKIKIAQWEAGPKHQKNQHPSLVIGL